MLTIALSASVASAQTVPTPPASQATQRDLAGVYRTRSSWQLVVTEGPTEKDYGDNDAPGKLTLCLYRNPGGPCIADPVTPPLRNPASNDAPAWEPHYLLSVRPVYPQGSGGRPLLMIVTGNLNVGDGDQIIATQLIKYDAAHDAFQRVFAQSVGHNNNQEVRFVERGPLMGSVIVAEPQQSSLMAIGSSCRCRPRRASINPCCGMAVRPYTTMVISYRLSIPKCRTFLRGLACGGRTSLSQCRNRSTARSFVPSPS